MINIPSATFRASFFFTHNCDNMICAVNCQDTLALPSFDPAQDGPVGRACPRHRACPELVEGSGGLKACSKFSLFNLLFSILSEIALLI
jgi:hypothetical protein